MPEGSRKVRRKVPARAGRNARFSVAIKARRCKQASTGSVLGFGLSRCEAFFAAGELPLHEFVEPVFEFQLGILGHAMKTKSGEAFDVAPGDFGFDFQVDVGSQEARISDRGAAPLGMASRSIRAMPPSLMLVLVAFRVLPSSDDLDLHLHRLAEVAAALFEHEVERGMKTSGRIEPADRLLQNEIGAHAEGFLRGSSLAVQDSESHRILVAGSISAAPAAGPSRRSGRRNRRSRHRTCR